MSETVGDWKTRKGDQAVRISAKHPDFKIDNYGDYGTKFVLVNEDKGRAIVIGSLPWDGHNQPLVDLSDEQIIKLIEADDGRT